MLEEARKLTSSGEILLWMTPSEAPKALQASECSELLDPMRASCWILISGPKQLAARKDLNQARSGASDVSHSKVPPYIHTHKHLLLESMW